MIGTMFIAHLMINTNNKWKKNNDRKNRTYVKSAYRAKRNISFFTFLEMRVKVN